MMNDSIRVFVLTNGYDGPALPIPPQPHLNVVGVFHDWDDAVKASGKVRWMQHSDDYNRVWWTAENTTLQIRSWDVA